MAVHIINRIYPRPMTDKTTYEIWRGKKPKLNYLHVIGSKCCILKDKEELRKFNTRSNEGFFLGYSSNSHAYHVFDK